MKKSTTAFARKKRGFSLVELLVTLAIWGPVSFVCVSLLMVFLSFYELSKARAFCLSQGEEVLCSLEPFVLGAGLGMPSRSLEAFKKAFSFPEGIFASLPYKDWGAVSVLSGGSRLRLVAGLPLGEVALEPRMVSPQGSSVPITDILPEYGRGCLAYVFPGSSLPFRNMDSSQKKLLLKSITPEKICLFDEVHGVYGVEFYLFGTTLYSRLFVDQIPQIQPRADHVAGFHCAYHKASSTLSVSVLVRYPRRKTSPHFRADIPGWDPAWKGLYDPHYYHFCFSRTWRIRN